MISLPLPILNAALILGAVLIAWSVDLGNRTARNILRAAVFGVGLTLGLIVVGVRLRGQSDKIAPKVSEVSLSLEPQVNAFLRENHRFADPNLTLDKLAKRIHIPARKISMAINLVSGMNVSQYINQMRLAHAAEMLLKSDDPVAHISEKSGFLTRSNFYREFQRVYGTTPAAYRDQARI